MLKARVVLVVLFDMLVSKFSYHQCDSIEAKSGCYSWFIDWTHIRKTDFEYDELKRVKLIEAIYEVYSPNPISIEAFREGFGKKQMFGEVYSGGISIVGGKSTKNIINICKNSNVFFSYLDFVNSLKIPLYIGKSKNLNRRIKQHLDFLDDFGLISLTVSDEEEREVLKNFSQRFQSVLTVCSDLGLRPNMLSVNIIYIEEDIITDFEYHLNRVYRPLFGLK